MAFQTQQFYYNLSKGEKYIETRTVHTRQVAGIDLEIRKLQKERLELPFRLNALKEIIEKKRTEIDEIKDKLADLRTRKAEVEDELELETERLKKSQQKMSAVKNNREFQALSKEIEEIKRSNKTRENEVLELEVNIEDLKEEVKKKTKEIEGLEQESLTEKKKKAKSEREIDAKIAELEREREAVAKEVKPELMARYRFLSEKRAGIVVAAVDEGVCSVCNMKIPPQMYNELLRDEKILYCPSCQRIIYALKV